MVRVALAGVGKMGLSHLAVFRSHPHVQIVGISDPARYVLGGLAEFTRLAPFTDFRDMLDRARPDAVVIATPSHLHAGMVREALERDIHVFCEKPFAHGPELGQVLADMANRRNLVGLVGYHYRYAGTFTEARRLIEAGAIGRVYNIHAEAYGPVIVRHRGGTWRSAGGMGGGCLNDYASHAIDLMNYMVGPPLDVTGSVLNRVFSAEVEDEVHATFIYADGLSGQLAANWSDDSQRKMSMRLSVWGEAGRIVVDRQEIHLHARSAPLAEAAGVRPGWSTQHIADLVDPPWFYLRGEEYSAEVDAFIAACRGERYRNLSPFASAVETDNVIAMIRRDAGKPRAVAQPRRTGRLFGALLGEQR